MAVPTGYAFYNIGFEIFCIILSVMLLYRQHTAFNENDTQRAFSVVLYLQILYFISMIFRVLVDIGTLPKTPGTVYLAAIVNKGEVFPDTKMRGEHGLGSAGRSARRKGVTVVCLA